MDFQKAFHKVPHARLICKLKAHGISGKILTWIENWSLNRKQRVVVNGKLSWLIDVLSGETQGSILGPLLFVIFINDLDDGVINKLLEFADDTKIVSKVGTAEDVKILHDDLHKLFQWSKDWQMILFNNTGKSKKNNSFWF